MDVAMGGLNTLVKGAVIILSALMVYTVYPHARDIVGGRYVSRAAKVHIPSGLDGESRRTLTLDLGGGDCLWQVRAQPCFYECIVEFTRV
jgi:hypothetical protein